MNEPFWLDVEILIDLHTEQLALFGGPDGIRDQGMLESALGRPINKFTYGETDLAALAAAYAFGIARNHPFVDGNKRAAFGALNGYLIGYLRLRAFLTTLVTLIIGRALYDALLRANPRLG